jgi:TRAP-type mannitol/chloroaromatic compound transport system permease small subunit
LNSAAKLAGGIDAFVDLVGCITSWLALGIALVMGANVLLRYGFSYGFIWAQELEWHIFVPICLFGMSYALLKGEHVRVDVLFQSFSPRAKRAVDVRRQLGTDVHLLRVRRERIVNRLRSEDTQGWRTALQRGRSSLD